MSEFLTGKSHFPRDGDMAGGHAGCQVHIPQSGFKIYLCDVCEEHWSVFKLEQVNDII